MTMYHTDTQNYESVDIIVPLKNVFSKVMLHSGITTMELSLTYTNTDSINPIEVSFVYPMREN